LPADDLRDAVPEQHSEHRERATVDEGGDECGDDAVGSRAVGGGTAEDVVAVDEVVRVRQGDEEQHEPASEVGAQRSLAEAGRSALGAHGDQSIRTRPEYTSDESP
jgi:hypothetical protein